MSDLLKDDDWVDDPSRGWLSYDDFMDELMEAWSSPEALSNWTAGYDGEPIRPCTGDVLRGVLTEARRLHRAGMPEDEDGGCFWCHLVEGHHLLCPWGRMAALLAMVTD